MLLFEATDSLPEHHKWEHPLLPWQQETFRLEEDEDDEEEE